METPSRKFSETSCHGRNWVLGVLTLGTLMIAVDGSIVTVALPAIKTALSLSDTALVWIVNAYFLTLGGFLLLAGRLGDLYGGRRLFLVGIALFTLASLGCGLAKSELTLIGARAIQGLGGAIVSAVSRGLALNLFPLPSDRAWAMSMFTFVQVSGGALGLMLGGYLTGAFDWNWIFLVNGPIGAGIYCWGVVCLRDHKVHLRTIRVDVLGAITITASLLIALYAVGGADEAKLSSGELCAWCGTAILVLMAFVWIEAHAQEPLIPLHLFRLRSFTLASVTYVLLSACAATWGVVCTLYLRLGLGLSPMQVALAFMPVASVSALYTLGFSARVIVRCGVKPLLNAGLTLTMLGFLLFSASSISEVPGIVMVSMLLIGFGVTVASTPLVLAGTHDIQTEHSGLASGVLSTACTIGAALGLALIVGFASIHTRHLVAAGIGSRVALTSGYHVAGLVCTGIIVAATISAALIRLEGSTSAPTLHEVQQASGPTVAKAGIGAD